MRNFFVRMCSTFFFMGNFPVAPGSFGTLAGVFLCVGLWNNLPVYVAVFAVVLAIGWWSAGETEKVMGEKDPGCVVIDEVAGIMVTYFMLPFTWPVLIVGYFLFRAFDMFKIWPGNKLETLGGGRGIMMDDVLAGLYANLTLQIALRLANLI